MRRVVAFIVSALPLVLAGCGPAAKSAAHSPSPGMPRQTPSGTGSGSVHPGHDTPAGVVDAYLKALSANSYSTACTYVQPSEQTKCVSAAAESKLNVTSLSFEIHGTVISGSSAVVAITGQICLSVGGCQSNTDPSKGMPSGPDGVSKAIAALSTNDAPSPIPCVYESGRWWVYLPGA